MNTATIRQITQYQAFAEEYASYSLSRGGYGKVLGGVIGIVIILMGTLVRRGTATAILTIGLTFMWLFGKEMIRARLYRPFGDAAQTWDPQERQTHVFVTVFVAFVSLIVVVAVHWLIYPDSYRLAGASAFPDTEITIWTHPMNDNMIEVNGVNVDAADAEGESPAPQFEQLQKALGINRVIHEPARLVVLAVLSKIDWAEFNFLLTATGLTKGNLSKQSARLEEVGYIEIEKGYKGRIPVTRYRITAQGKADLERYMRQMNAFGEELNTGR
jgi:DNA-binding MarR family transcriptional regulator